MGAEEDLHRQILEAHAQGAPERLAVLYREAGLAAETAGLIDRACFFFTQAYVFALETGDRNPADELKSRLVGYGREE